MTARGVFPIDLLTETFPTVPDMPDVGSKLLIPRPTTWAPIGTSGRGWPIPFDVAGRRCIAG